MSSSFLLLLFLVPLMGQSCDITDGDREFLLDKVKAQIMEALGQPQSASSSGKSLVKPEIPKQVARRILRKRHNQRGSAVGEDASQVILFPSSDVLCEIPDPEAPKAEAENRYTYVFHPSSHILSRRVSSVEFWFYTGKSKPQNPSFHKGQGSVKKAPEDNVASPNQSLCHGQQRSNESSEGVRSDSKEETAQVDIQVLSEEEPITVATIKVHKVGDWTVFYLASAFHGYFTKSLFVLLVHCPSCPCSDEPENTPFLMFHTRPVQRGRRATVPWSPSALELLQRPPALGEDNKCHRGSINITFEELGWNQWIVYPGSFQFHYCHGTCSPSHGLSSALHWGNCCAALPSTMKPLRVTTTTDGGFSFRYEVVPNLITQDCACS